MPHAMIRIKRVYEKPTSEDGLRVLVDRLWPRGMSRERAALDFWLRELAPSNELRRWYGHQTDRWPEFQHRYTEELAAVPEAVERLLALVRQGPVSLLFAAKEPRLNNAQALKEYLERRLGDIDSAA